MNPPVYHNFPKEGVEFEDIFPCLNHPPTLSKITEWLSSSVITQVVIAPETRGLLLASLIWNTGVTIVPLRKEGKLPFHKGDLRIVPLSNEYSSYNMEYRLSDFKGATKVTIIDDVIATGGTLRALCASLATEGIEVVSILALKDIFNHEGESNHLPPKINNLIKTYYEHSI